MSTVYDLMATLGIDTSDYDQGLDDAEGRAGGFSSVISGLGAVGGGILAGGLALAGAAATALGAGLAIAWNEASEAQDNLVILETIIGNTGDTTGVTVDMVNDLATSMSTLTRYEDDQVIAAGAVLARFEQINSDAFPRALSLSADLATVLGVDLTSASLMIGKALAVPGEGLLRLKQAGVAFTDEEEAMIQAMMDAGDTAGAQAYIMERLEEAIGGAAEAAGGTAAGQWQIFKNQVSNIFETLGAGLIPALTDLGTTLNEYVARPEVQEIIEGISTAIGDFAANVVAWLPTAVEWIQNAFGWLMDNKGVIVGVLAAVGVAIAAFAINSAIALAPLVAELAPIYLVLAVIAGAAYLLYEAWANNWGGIRDTLTEAWAAIQPVLQLVWDWLSVNIPLAIQAVSEWWSTVFLPTITAAWAWVQANIFPIIQTLVDVYIAYLITYVQNLALIWNTYLLPALQAVWEFISGTLWPLFQAVAEFIGAVFGLVVEALAAIWTGILLPALTAVWDFIITYVWPLFQAVAEFIGAVFNLVLTVLAGIWENVLQPAIQTVYEWIADKLQPIFETLAKFWEDTVMPIIEALSAWFDEHLSPAFETLGGWVQKVIDWFNGLTDAIQNISLPDWLTPGSPTPFELGLRGIADALEEVNRTGLPEFGGTVTYSRTPGMDYEPSRPIVVQTLTLQPIFQGVGENVDVVNVSDQLLEEMMRRIEEKGKQ